MAYIGQDPVIGRYIIVDQISGGFNGTASGFTLAAGGQGVIPGLAQNVLLSLGGVIQQPGTDYTVSGSGITFTTPPLSGTTFFATVLGDVQAVGTPSDGTVLPASIATSGTFVFPNLTTTGTTLIASGNASTPSLAIIGDTNTGLYSPGADQLAISTNGTGRLFVNASGQVGVNISSPDGTTHVHTATAGAVTANTSADDLVVENSGAGGISILTPDASNGSIFFGTPSDAAGAAIRWNYSTGEFGIGPDKVGGYLRFNSDDGIERMRLTSAGALGLGSSSPALRLHASIADATAYTTASDGNVLRLANTTAGGFSGISFTTEPSAGNAGIASINSFAPSGGDSVITFSTRQGSTLSERVRIAPDGKLGIGATPSELLHVSGGLVRLEDGASGSVIRFYKSSAQTAFIANRSFGFHDGNGLALQTSTADPIRFAINDSEAVRIDSSKRLLVGTSTALSTNTGALLQLYGTGGSEFVGSSANNNPAAGDPITMIRGLSQSGSSYGTCATIAIQSDATTSLNDYPGRIVFSTTADGSASPSEAMRIDSSGSVLIRRTGFRSGTTNACSLNVRGLGGDWTADFENPATTAANCYGIVLSYSLAAPNNTGNQFFRCSDSSAVRAEIRSNGGLANFSANNANLSDRNAKKDIAPAADTWNCLKEWEIVNYRYKDQPDDADLNLGVIAQQVAESCPEVITIFQEAKEATEDALAQEERLGVKEQQMYWMAIKALQEAQVRIEQLEAKVAALEGA